LKIKELAGIVDFHALLSLFPDTATI